MVRIVITYLIPLVLPVIAWYAWQHLSRSRARNPEQATDWAAAPWDRLGIAGVILLAATLGWFAAFTGAKPGSVYQPARLVDGEIVPGRQIAQPPSPPGTGN